MGGPRNLFSLFDFDHPQIVSTVEKAIDRQRVTDVTAALITLHLVLMKVNALSALLLILRQVGGVPS